MTRPGERDPGFVAGFTRWLESTAGSVPNGVPITLNGGPFDGVEVRVAPLVVSKAVRNEGFHFIPLSVDEDGGIACYRLDPLPVGVPVVAGVHWTARTFHFVKYIGPKHGEACTYDR